MNEIRSRLLAKNRKVLKTTSIDMDGSPIQVNIIKPTLGDQLAVIEKAQIAGEVDDEGKPTSTFNGARLGARMIIACVYLDGQPLFGTEDQEAIVLAPWFEDVAKLVGEVFSPDEAELRKNS